MQRCIHTWGMNLVGHAAKCVVQSELLPGRLCSSSRQNCLKSGGHMFRKCNLSKEDALVSLLG